MRYTSQAQNIRPIVQPEEITARKAGSFPPDRAKMMHG